MRKIAKIFMILLFIVSCATTSMNISRSKGYELNRKYIKENYNKDVVDQQVGFYFTKNTYEFFSLIGDDIYHIVIGVNGELISKETYPAYDPIIN